MTGGGWQEFLFRFMAGGGLVCAFAVLGEPFRPKTFAGIFGAAPSVALATLALAFATHGPGFAATEARSMMLGAMAFVVYASASALVVRRPGLWVWLGAILCWIVWAAVAFALWAVLG